MTPMLTAPLSTATRPTDIRADELLEHLGLLHARRVWKDLAARAERESWSYQDYLVMLLAEEVGVRQGARVAQMSRAARFPFVKTVEEFDFRTYEPAVLPSIEASCLAPEFVTEGRCLLLSGPGGRGK